MKIFLDNLGCDKNRVDGEKLLARLIASGFEQAFTAAEADLVIVNTCGFIQPAKEESIETILDHASHTKVAVTGCLSERYLDTLQKELTEAVVVAGLSDKEATYKTLIDTLSPQQPTLPAPPSLTRALTGPVHSAPLKISEGCDNRCSYCAIPLIRGSFVPRSEQDILSEARLLRKKGVQELLVVGQDITAYGKRKGLPALLRKLTRLSPAFHWIRLMYCHPLGVTDELIEVMTSESRILPYLDLPLQHYTDKLLKRMNRHYTGKEAAALIRKLRKRVPSIALRTTLLLGFPGETETDFRNLYSFVKDTEFDRLGVFAFSPEEETQAFGFKNRVASSTVKKRMDRLMELQNDILYRQNLAKVGSIQEVLIDGAEGDVWIGRTRHDAPEVDCRVVVRNCKLVPGRFYKLKITDADTYDLFVHGYSHSIVPGGLFVTS
ncbi:MAG: ribosomal protein S12 methylthiotransferase RimO [Elusimicrobia bacterium RIFOXYB2_FULL_49_7]|nr:MAG: ribosomal protein S12 methylthiotransferase RimO [Elusimicrobia bacterium RIFOXYB2_FULL_49_7]